ncbi:MAG: AI-2E family transporter [Bacillota bacterium]|nr:AI-2E family transporter [Bacillota bacterium]
MGGRWSWRRAGWAAAVLAAALLLWRVRHALLPFFLGAVLAYVVEPAVAWFQRRGLGRGWAMLLVLLLGGLALAALVALLAPLVGPELAEASRRLPGALRRLQALGAGTERALAAAGVPAGLLRWGRRFLRRAGLQLEEGLTRGLADWSTLSEWVGSLLLSPVIAFYLVREWPEWRERLWRRLPAAYRPAAQRMARAADRVLGSYLRGELWLSLAVGAVTALAFALAGTPFAVLLGFLTALGELIPYFGPVLALLPAAAAGFLRSTRTGLLTLLAWLVIQQLESGVIGPRLLSGGLGLHPLTVVLALLVGESLGGALGIFLAVPLFALARALLPEALRLGRDSR